MQQELLMMLMEERDDANDDNALLWRCHPVLLARSPGSSSGGYIYGSSNSLGGLCSPPQLRDAPLILSPLDLHRNHQAFLFPLY